MPNLHRKEKNIARSVQVKFESHMLKMCKSLKNRYGIDKLVMASECALNGVFNYKLEKKIYLKQYIFNQRLLTMAYVLVLLQLFLIVGQF